MYGPGLAPQRRPTTASLVLLRVIFVLLSMLSIGFLAWAALLRVAVVTRRKLDWGLFWTGVVMVVAATVFLASDPTDEISTWRGYLGMTLLLVSAIASTAYYLYADIRHHDTHAYAAHPEPPAGGGGAGAGGYVPHSAYGYPQPHPGPVQTAVPGSGPSVGQHTMPRSHPMSGVATPIPQQTPAPQQAASPYGAAHPVPGPPGGPHTPPGGATPGTPYPPHVPITPAQSGQGRIDQVRAELDELSDFLRRQGDGGGQHPGGTGSHTPHTPDATGPWGAEGGR